MGKQKVIRMKLDNESFGYIIELLYNTDDAKKYHNTDSLDKYAKEELKKKMTEMVDCNNHKPCKIMSQLMLGEVKEMPELTAKEKKKLCNHNLDEPVYHPCKDCPWNGKVKCPYYVEEDEKAVFAPS